MSSRVSTDHTPYTIAHLAPAWAKEMKGRKSSGDPRMLELIEATKDQFSTITTSRAFEKFISKRGSGTNPPNFKVTDDGIYLENESDHTYTHISTLIKSSSPKPGEAAELYQAARTIMDKAREIFSKPASPAPRSHHKGHRRASAREKTPSLSPSASPPTTKKLNELSEKVASLDKTIVILKWQLLTAQTQKTRDQAHIQELTDALQHSEAALGRLQQEHTTLLDELRRTQEIVNQLSPRLISLEALQTEQLAAIQGLRESLVSKEREIQAMAAALSSLRAENPQLQSALSIANTRVQELEGLVAQLRPAAESNATAIARLTEARTELASARGELADLQAASAKKDSQIRDLRDALAASTDAQSRLQSNLDAKTQELSAATVRISLLGSQLAAQITENTTLSAHVERLQRAAEEAAGLRPQLEAANRSATDLSARVSALEEDLRTRFSALEAATGISINAGQSYEAYLRRIREHRTGREDEIRRLQQELAGHTALLDELRGVTQQKQAAEGLLSTLRALSERIKTNLGMRGTPSPEQILGEANTTLERQTAEISRLTRELDAVRASLSSERSRHADAERGFEATLSSLRQELDTTTAAAAADSAAANDRYRTLEASFTEMQARLTAENDALTAAAERIRRRDDRLERELTQIESILGISRTEGELEASFLTRLEDALTQKTRGLSEAQTALAQLRAKAAGDQQTIASLQTRNQELELTIQAERKKTDTSKEKLTALTAERDAVQLTLQTQASSYEVVKGRLEAELSTVQAELASVGEELATAKAQAKAGDIDARTRHDELTRTLQELQSELEVAKARILALQGENEALNERYSALDPLVSSIESSLGIRTKGGTAVSTLLEGIFRTIQTRNEELSSATKAFGLAQSELDRLNAEAASDKETIAGLQSQRDKLAQALGAASVQIGEMKAALALSTDGNAALEAKIRDAEARRAEAITLQQQATLSFTQREANQAGRILVQDRKITDLESEISALKGQVALAGIGNAELERNLKAAQDELAAVRSDLEAQLSQARAQAAASEQKLSTALDDAISQHKEELAAANKEQRALGAQLKRWGDQYTETLGRVEIALERAIKGDADPNELCHELEKSGKSGLAGSLRAIYQSMQETKEALAAKNAQIGSLEENSRAQDDEINELKSLLGRALRHAQTGLGETEDQRHPTKNESIPGKVQTLADLTLRLKELQKSTVAEKEAETKKLAAATTSFQNKITDLKTSLASKESEVEFQSAYITSQKAAAKKTESELTALETRLAALQAAKDSSDSDHADEVAPLKSQIDILRQALEDSRSKVAKQEETLTNQQDEIENLTARISVLEQELAKQNDILDTAYQAALKLNNDNDQLQAEIDKLRGSYEEQIALQKTLLTSTGFSTTTALQSELAAINQLLSLTAGGATASGRIRQLQEDLASSLTKGLEATKASDALIERLQGELDALRSSSSAEVAAAATRAEDLTTKLREQQVATLQVEAQRNALQEANAKLEAQHKVKVSDLEGAIAAQKNTIKDLEGNVSRLTTALEASEAARSKLERSTTALQSELEEAKKALAASTAENESLKGRVSELTAEKEGFIATIDAQKHKIAALQWDNAILRAKLRKHEIRELERAERGNFTIDEEYDAALAETTGAAASGTSSVDPEVEEIISLYKALATDPGRGASAEGPLVFNDLFPIDYWLLTGAIRCSYEDTGPVFMIDKAVLRGLGATSREDLEAIGVDPEKQPRNFFLLSPEDKVALGIKENPGQPSYHPLTKRQLDSLSPPPTEIKQFYKAVYPIGSGDRVTERTLFARFHRLYLEDIARSVSMGGTSEVIAAKVFASLKIFKDYCKDLKQKLQTLANAPAIIKEKRARIQAIETSASGTNATALRALLEEKRQLEADIRSIEAEKAKTPKQILIDSITAKAGFIKTLITVKALIESLNPESRARTSTQAKDAVAVLGPTGRLLYRLLSEISPEELRMGRTIEPAAPAPKPRRSGGGGASGPPRPAVATEDPPVWQDAARHPRDIVGGGGAHGTGRRETPKPGHTVPKDPRL
jgi:chromosome segregation ATPase